MHKPMMLNNLKVSDVWDMVISNPTSIGPQESLERLLEKVVEDTRTRHVYVVDEQLHLVGVVRLTTVAGVLFPLQAIDAEMSQPYLFDHINFGGRTVEDIMKSRPLSVVKDSEMQDVVRIFFEEKITELPVVDEHKRLTGQVNMYEIIKYYLEFLKEDQAPD